LGSEGWIVTDSTHAADREHRVECKAGPYGSARLIWLSKKHKRSAQVKVCERIISVGLKASTQPRNSFGIRTLQQLGNTDPMQPAEDA
jgi:hypothetical protein